MLVALSKNNIHIKGSSACADNDRMNLFLLRLDRSSSDD